MSYLLVSISFIRFKDHISSEIIKRGIEIYRQPQ